MDVNRLYKYRNLNQDGLEYVERIFTKQEVYFSRPLDFNDPFDSLPKFSLEATQKEIEHYLQVRFPRHYPELNRHERRAQIKSLLKGKRLSEPSLVSKLESAHREKILEQTGVFCLSAIPDHILMWSHYAMAHTGICIEFEATSHTDFFGLAQQVHYCRKIIQY